MEFEGLLRLLLLMFSPILRLLGKKRPEPCAFNCPHCGEVRVGKRHERVKYDEDMRPVDGRSWIECETCHRQFNADAFHADESGVYELESELARRREAGVKGA